MMEKNTFSIPYFVGNFTFKFNICGIKDHFYILELRILSCHPGSLFWYVLDKFILHLLKY